MPILVKRLFAALVIVLLLIAMNQFMSDEGLFGFGVPPYYGRVVMLAGINVILAVSLNLITGFTGQFSIGHAGFMAVGAYTSAYLTVYYAQAWERSLAGMLGATVAHALIFLLAILVGAIVAALAGLVVGIPSLRLRGDYLAIVTLGFAEIIRIVILNIDKVGGATGFTVPGYTNFLWVGIFAVLTIVIVYNIVHSDMGRALVSIREDELAAEAMGINTTRYKVLSFVISSALAGMAGVRNHHHDSARRYGFADRRSFRGDSNYHHAGVATQTSRRSFAISTSRLFRNAHYHHAHSSAGVTGHARVWALLAEAPATAP